MCGMISPSRDQKDERVDRVRDLHFEIGGYLFKELARSRVILEMLPTLQTVTTV